MNKKNWDVDLKLQFSDKKTAEEVERLIYNQLRYYVKPKGRIKAK